MHCPNCGTTTLDEQQYCRVCGTSLTHSATRRISSRALGLSTVTLVFLGLLVAMIGKLVELRWLSFAGVFVMIGGMFLVAISAFLRETRPRESRLQKPLPTPSTIEKAETTNKLLPIGDNDYIPSVTEATTDLLQNVAVASKLRDNSDR